LGKTFKGENDMFWTLMGEDTFAGMGTCQALARTGPDLNKGDTGPSEYCYRGRLDKRCLERGISKKHWAVTATHVESATSTKIRKDVAGRGRW